MADFIEQKLADNNKVNKKCRKFVLNIKYHMITKKRKIKRKLHGLK